MIARANELPASHGGHSIPRAAPMSHDDRRRSISDSEPTRRADVLPGENDTRIPRQLVEELIQAWSRDARMLGVRPGAGILLAHAAEAAEFGAHDLRRAAELYTRSAEHPDRDPRAFAGLRRIARQAHDIASIQAAYAAELAQVETPHLRVIAAIGLATGRMRDEVAAEQVLAPLREVRDMVARVPADLAALWRSCLEDALVYAGRAADALKARTQRWNDVRAAALLDDEELAAEAVDVAIAADALLDAHDVAARWYEAAFEISPSLASVGALVRRAHDARDHAAAEALLSQYVATEDDPDVRGQLQYELGWLRVAIEDRPGALSAMSEATHSGITAPASASAFLGLARASHRSVVAGEFVDALGATLDFATGGAERADLLVQMAQRFDAELGMTEAAVELAREALGEVPTFHPAIHLLGRLYRRLGLWSELVALGEHELTNEADAAERTRLHERLAEVYLEELNDTAGGERHLRSAHTIGPHLPVVRRLARLLAEQHRWNDLFSHLTDAAARVSSPRERAYMLEQAAEIAETKLRDSDQAIGVYRALLALRQDHPGAISSLGRLLSQTNRWRDLLELNEVELSLNARDTATRVSIFCRSAEIAGRYLGDTALSEEYFRRALEENSACDEALRGLGTVLTSQRRWDDLVLVTERELAAARSPAHRARCLRMLGELQATRMESPADAVRTFEQLASLGGIHLQEALVWLERLYQAQGAWDEVLGVLERRLAVLADATSVARIAFRRAELLEWRLGRPAEAFTAYLAALADPVPAGLLALAAIDRLWQAADVDREHRLRALEVADQLAEHEDRRIRTHALQLLAQRSVLVRGPEASLGAWSALHGERPDDAVASEMCALDALRRGDYSRAEQLRRPAIHGGVGSMRSYWAQLDAAAAAEAEVAPAIPGFAVAFDGFASREAGLLAGFEGAHEREIFARIGHGRVTLGTLREGGDSETGLRLAAMATAALGDLAAARRHWSALAESTTDPMRATRLRVDCATQPWMNREERSRWLRDAAGLGCYDPPLRDELYAEFRASGDVVGLEQALQEHLRAEPGDANRASELARQRATCLELLGRRDDAIDALRFCAVHTPGDAEVSLEKARLETLADRVDDARSTLEDCLSEGVHGAARLQVLGRLADLHQMNGGARERALSALESAWALSSAAREWGIRLASAHASFGRAERCAELLEQILVRPPHEDDIRHWHLLSRVYATRLDRRDEAEKVLWEVFMSHPERSGALTGLEDFYRRFKGASTFADRLADALAARRIQVGPEAAADLWTYIGELNLTVLRRFPEAEKAYTEARRTGGDAAGLLLREARAVAGQLDRPRDAARLVVRALENAAPDVAFWDEAAHDLDTLFGEMNDTARQRVVQQLRRALGARVETNDDWIKRDPTRTIDAATAWSLIGRGLLDEAEREVLVAAAPLAERVLARIGPLRPEAKGKRLRGAEYAAFDAFVAAATQWIGAPTPKLLSDAVSSGVQFVEPVTVAIPALRVGVDQPARARFWAGFAAGMTFSGLGAYSWAEEFAVRDMLRALASRALNAPYAASESMALEVGGLLLAGVRRAAAPVLREHIELLERTDTRYTMAATCFADRVGLVFCGDLSVAIEEILRSSGWEADVAEQRTREYVLADPRTTSLIRWAISDAHHLVRYESGLAPRPGLFD